MGVASDARIVDQDIKPPMGGGGVRQFLAAFGRGHIRLNHLHLRALRAAQIGGFFGFGC